LNRGNEKTMSTIMRNHKELYLDFKKKFNLLEKCEKIIDRTQKKVRNYELVKSNQKAEMIHISKLENVLLNSLNFGFLFASKIFDINDSIKEFYQLLGLKKDLLSKMFNIGLTPAIKLLNEYQNVWNKESVIYNEHSQSIDHIFQILKKFQSQDFKSIPEFISFTEQTITNLKNIPIVEGLEFLSKSSL
jgi:hypothetical protein